MQCHSCGASLPPKASVCPQCQAATPYNTRSLPSEESNPYGDEAFVDQRMEDKEAQRPAAPASVSPLAGDDKVPAKEATGPLQEPSLSTQPEYYQQTVPNSHEQATPAPQPAYRPVPAPSYSSVQPGMYSTPSPIGGPAESIPFAIAPARKDHTRLWLTLLTITMIIIVTALVLVPILRGIHPQTGPSGNTIIASAAAIISKVEMASSIDQEQQTYTRATTFKVSTTYYIILTVDPNRFDFSRYTGYFLAGFYLNGSPVTESQPQVISSLHPIITVVFPKTGQADFEFYWCTMSDCADEQLARVFTVMVTN